MHSAKFIPFIKLLLAVFLADPMLAWAQSVPASKSLSDDASTTPVSNAQAQKDRARLDELLSNSDADWNFKSPSEKEIMEIFSRAVTVEPDRVVRLLAKLHTHAKRNHPESNYARDPLMYLSLVEWSLLDGSGGAPMARAAIKLDQLGLTRPDIPASFEDAILSNLLGWMRTSAPGESLPRQRRVTAERVVAHVEACPADFLTTAEASSVLPVLLHVIKPLLEQPDHITAIPAAAARLAKPGPGGGFRVTMSHALSLLSLQDSRRQAWKDEGRKAKKQAGETDFRHLQLFFAENPILRGIEDEALLIPAQKAFIDFLTEDSISHVRRIKRLAWTAHDCPLIFDPPVAASAVKFLASEIDSAKLKHAQRKPSRYLLEEEAHNRAMLTQGLAASCACFATPEQKRWLMAQQQLASIFLKLRGDASASPIPYEVVFHAVRNATDSDLKQFLSSLAEHEHSCLSEFRLMVHCRRFEHARWLLENAADNIFTRAGPPHHPEDLYSPRTAECLSEFQKTLPEGVLRLMARAALETASDGPEMLRAPSDHFEKRMNELAKSLLKEDLPAQWQRRLKNHFISWMPRWQKK